MSDILLFSFALVDTGALIFILVFFIITLSGEFLAIYLLRLSFPSALLLPLVFLSSLALVRSYYL
jgi:hypothetical protein